MYQEFGQIRTQIFIRTAGLCLTAVLIFFLVYRFFVRGKFADFMVSFFQSSLRMDYDAALNFYQQIFRNFEKLFYFIFIAAVFLFLLHIYLGWFSRYFAEIDRQMGRLLGEDTEEKAGEISLSPELIAIERKMNQLKYRMEKQKSDMLLSEKRKNDLIMYLAHDLKTPLASVIGYLNLLRDEGEISGELREKYLDISLGKAERLEELINEFFEIARYNLSDITLQYSRINFSRLLEQLVYEFGPMLAEKNLTVSLQMEEDILFSCDADKMQRVFDNLLRNAVLYSFRDTEIRITAEQQKYALIVRFSNHGNPISKEKLERLFEQFYRLDTARSTESGGCAGLGLAIAKQIVELHNGTITAKSEAEVIEFTVTLPVIS
ncbi:MAG: HAMP domain-containing histidine kinase [Lachnospiraceae bacterium]|nr:HAMP domain-containing histidine kinase [Lachnospiraceae bacterium]